MEAVVMHGSFDQTKSHIGNPKRIIHHRSFISRPSENFFPPPHLMGLLQPPSPLPLFSHSYPPYSAQLQQPPLLPLPAAPRRSAASRGLSCPPAANKKANNNGNKKLSKSPTKKGEKKSSPKKCSVYYNNNNILSPVSGDLGPDPKELMKDVGKVNFSGVNFGCEDQNKVDVFSGTGSFAISPPPSSLPLPTFSLRPKLVSCKAEAVAGIDAGATDNLRRLLRLR